MTILWGPAALSMIVRKIPNVLPKFEDMLDHAITLAEHDINDVDCELKMDFKVLIPNPPVFSLPVTFFLGQLEFLKRCP